MAQTFEGVTEGYRDITFQIVLDNHICSAHFTYGIILHLSEQRSSQAPTLAADQMIFFPL